VAVLVLIAFFFSVSSRFNVCARTIFAWITTAHDSVTTVREKSSEPRRPCKRGRGCPIEAKGGDPN